MIDYEASFWSIPRSEWDSLYVRCRLEDWPEPEQWIDDRDSATKVWLVGELVRVAPPAEFAFRTIELFSDPSGSRLAWFEPLLIDIDISLGDQAQADEILSRCVAVLRAEGWEYRAFHSGEGYHLEVAGRSALPNVERIDRGWYEGFRKSFCEEARVKNIGQAAAVVDTIGNPPKMLRMVGSRNRKGGYKRPYVIP